MLRAVSGRVERFSDETGEVAVRGALHRPAAGGGDAVVLTHGAGSDHDAPVLRAVAEAHEVHGA